MGTYLHDHHPVDLPEDRLEHHHLLDHLLAVRLEAPQALLVPVLLLDLLAHLLEPYLHPGDHLVHHHQEDLHVLLLHRVVKVKMCLLLPHVGLLDLHQMLSHLLEDLQVHHHQETDLHLEVYLLQVLLHRQEDLLLVDHLLNRMMLAILMNQPVCLPEAYRQAPHVAYLELHRQEDHYHKI